MYQRTLFTHALLVATLTTSAVATAGLPAGAQPVIACGDEITADTTLAADVGPCTADGLRITAADITLNLNGFTVSGDNGDGDNAGIQLVGVSGVTVTNGTVQGFDAGILIDGGNTNTVHGVTVQDNVNDFLGGACLLGDGIAIRDSSENNVSGSRVLRNGPFGGVSVIGDSDRNVISRNQVADNNIPGPGCGNALQDEGIRIEGPGANDNRVENNVVERSLLSGIGLHGYVCAPPNPAVPPGAPNSGTMVINNVVKDGSGTSIASGINFLQQGPATIVCPSFGNTILRNTSTGNGANGIFVSANSYDNVINRNVVTDNGGAGILLNGPRMATNFTNVGPTLFDLIAPDLAPFTEDTDYAVMFGSGSGDVTANLVAIDLAIPSGDPINPNPVDTSTSACEPEDFTAAGFAAGDIALIQRGTCTFVSKIANAVAAGASAVVMFNEGQTGRTSPSFGSSGDDIPALSASYALGMQLADLLANGPVTANIVTNTTSEIVVAAPGAYNNTLRNNRGTANGTFDGFDGNLEPPCDNNKWRANVFATVNQDCVLHGGSTPPVVHGAAESHTGPGVDEGRGPH